MMSMSKPVPRPSAETQVFWEGCAAEELRLPRCTDCDKFFFPPREFCPTCFGLNVVWEKASGKATLHSYVINHRPPPGWSQDGPYAIAIVALEEGIRMMSNILGIENTPENLVLDMPLQLTFERRDDVNVPQWRPA